MLLPIVIALTAVALGLGFGLAPAGLRKLIGPLRTFALTSALAVACTHLLPEAFQELGGAGVLVFAAGLAFPALLRLARALTARGAEREHADALEFGYLGLLVHHVADGMGLGAYGGEAGERHLDVLLALAVHTIPLVAVVTLAYRDRGGVKAAVARSAGLGVASVLGVLVSRSVPEEAGHRFSAWVAAAVAGLLVHVVTHDLERDLPETSGTRAFDLLAAVSGVVISVLAAGELGHWHDHAHGGAHDGVVRLYEISAFLGIPLLLGFAVAAGFELLPGPAPSPAWRDAWKLSRALSLREEPDRARSAGPRAGFVLLLLASSVGFDALALGVWLSGVGFELARFAGVVALGFVAYRLLPGPRLAPSTGEGSGKGEGERRKFVPAFAELVARESPWLVTSIVLAALLDATLAPGALAGLASPYWLGAVAVALSLPLRLEAAAAAPVLAVLVGKGLPPSVALATWVVLSAPGERALLALAKGRSARVLWLGLALTSAVGLAVAFGAEALSLAWSPPPHSPAVERVGAVCALLLALPVLTTIWREGLRGWLSVVFLHEHGHEHRSAHPHAH